MLGRSWQKADPVKAAAWFVRTREEAAAGRADSLGLAAASLGWQGRAELDRKRYTHAIDLYWRQHAASDPSAAMSLRSVAAKIAWSEQTVLTAAAGHGRSRRVVTAFLIARGVETLSLRMPRHCANAMTVAEFLAGHPAVGEVRYPGLHGDPGYDLAREILPDGCGAMVGFTLGGGQAALDCLKGALKLVRPWVSLGDTGSLVYGRHPEPRKGIPEGFARLSVGLEAVDDIIADIKQALETLRK